MFLRQFGLPVSDGTNVPVPELVTPESYRRVIAFVSGVTDKRAAAIAAEYPVFTYPSPIDAFSELVRDANFACPALQMDAWTSRRMPTFAYEFNDVSLLFFGWRRSSGVVR